jgi:hypothetical protein
VTGTETFGWIVLLVAAVGVAGVLSNRLTAWSRVPAPPRHRPATSRGRRGHSRGDTADNP